MRLRPQVALFTIALAALLAQLNCAFAQSGIALAQNQADSNQSDQTLEIAPRIAPTPPPVAEPTPPAQGESGDDAAPTQDSSASASQQAAPANATHPYLGIAVQTIYSNDRPGSLVTGLEVVSIDRNSPAAIAGLHGRTKMSSIGETGATASTLMAPLNLFMMPLLKKTGSLGQNGDLIVAIDDRRVSNDFDLQSELGNLKPGDVIYLTITRTMDDGSQKTLKLPIKLGDPAQATAADDDDAVPISPTADSPVKHP